MDFKLLKSAVAGQFEKMKKHKLFITGTDKDELWNLYLDSFPEGTVITSYSIHYTKLYDLSDTLEADLIRALATRAGREVSQFP